MVITNQERVGKAMELLRAGLAPFIEREFNNLPCDGLGYEILYGFKDHDGFDAVIPGSPRAVLI
jgi:hypothetical protein